jgi:hypothetical protein
MVIFHDEKTYRLNIVRKSDRCVYSIVVTSSRVYMCFIFYSSIHTRRNILEDKKETKRNEMNFGLVHLKALLSI